MIDNYLFREYIREYIKKKSRFEFAKILNENLRKTISTIPKTRDCWKNLLSIKLISIVRKILTRSLQHCSKKILVTFWRIIELLILIFLYIWLINFVTLKILLLLFRDILLKSKRENLFHINIKQQQYAQKTATKHNW